MDFSFTPPRSDKARLYLERCVEHVATLNPVGQRTFLASRLEQARDFPVSVDVSAFDKSLVLITLQSWLDQTQEAA